MGKAFCDFLVALWDTLSAAFKWCVDQINTEGTFLNTIWEGIKTFISAAIDVIKNVIRLFTAVLKGDWSSAWEAIKNIVKTVWDAISSVISNCIAFVKGIISDGLSVVREVVSNVLSAVAGFFKERWEAIKTTVSNVISGIKTTISNGLDTARSKVSSTLETIKGKFESIFENCKKVVSDAIEAIKKLFDFELKLDIKLPHVSVSGGEAPYGIGGKGKLPTFDVKWYKTAYDNAMILSNPTIFGYSNGKFLGGGDGNGNEIVAGESHLMNLIGQVVESRTGAQNEQIISVLVAILEAITGGNEEMVRAIMADKTWSVGGREFARLVKTYA